MSIRRTSLPNRHRRLCHVPIWHNLCEHDMINLVFRRPNNAPSERPTPVAPDHNIPLAFRTTMRNFLFSPRAGLITGRTRDLVHFPGESREVPAVRATDEPIGQYRADRSVCRLGGPSPRFFPPSPQSRGDSPPTPAMEVLPIGAPNPSRTGRRNRRVFNGPR